MVNGRLNGDLNIEAQRAQYLKIGKFAHPPPPLHHHLHHRPLHRNHHHHHHSHNEKVFIIKLRPN